MLCSEVWKQLTLTFALGGGTYNWWYFPFQLCSIPMYVLLAYPWLRREAIRRGLLAFLMCYGLLGGLAAFADQSGLRYPLAALTAHSYLWHIALILIGIGAGDVYCRRYAGTVSSGSTTLSGSTASSGSSAPSSRRALFSETLSRTFPLRPFFNATLIYLSCCLAAVFLNLSLDGLGRINLFYINPDYPMQQIVFRKLVPLIGNGPAIFAYTAASILGAFLLFRFWKIFFRIRSR